MTAIEQHDRMCGYAFSAMETLRDKQRHAVHCVQCKSDPAWCNTAKGFDEEFNRQYQLWLRYRGSNGVVIPREIQREPVATKGAS